VERSGSGNNFPEITSWRLRLDGERRTAPDFALGMNIFRRLRRDLFQSLRQAAIRIGDGNATGGFVAPHQYFLSLLCGATESV
jgi:hypothetical protein